MKKNKTQNNIDYKSYLNQGLINSLFKKYK